MNWLIEVFKKHALRIVVYTVISVGTVFVFYNAFIRPTTKTTYTGAVLQSHALENPKYAPFSCARIIIQKEK